MSTAFPSQTSDDRLRDALSGAFSQLNLKALSALEAKPAADARRAFRFNPKAFDAEPKVASLVRQNGLLRWEFAAANRIAVGNGLRAGRAALIPGEIVHQFEFEELPPNQVSQAITWVDRKLTPAAWLGGKAIHGLRRLQNGNPVDYVLDSKIASEKRVFLLVHGTASNCDKLLSDLQAAPGGPEFLAALDKAYDLVLAFDHPTLSISPMVNAVDLAGLLRPSSGRKPPKQIDIVCHSRGGLVTRWFCEAFADPATRHRAILVGAPIAGTSLAAPPNLKKALDFITNVTEILEKAADAFSAEPFIALTGALLKAFNLAVNLTAKTPLPDLVLQIIPGLAAQQRVGNNAEIDRLRRYTGDAVTGGASVEYFAVKSNFNPEDPGWNILGYFSKPLQRIVNAGADLIFECPNDLVVDTGSMDEVADRRTLAKDHVLDFGDSTTVHHTNYFRQKRTVDFIRQRFAVRG